MGQSLFCILFFGFVQFDAERLYAIPPHTNIIHKGIQRNYPSSFNQVIVEVPFELQLGGSGSMIPGPVLKRVTGKQSPVVPHCQRLLVASRKEAKMPKAPNAAGPKAKAKAKAKTKAKTKAKNPKKAKGKGKGKTQKTDYALAKAAFFSSLQLVKSL